MGTLRVSLSAAYDLVRVQVGQMLSEVSESVMGAAVVRAYGLEERIELSREALGRGAVPCTGPRAPAHRDAVR